MQEHVPPRLLILALWAFFIGMSVATLIFWTLGIVWQGGLSGLMATLGPGAVATLVALHIPAAIIGILLWQWTRHALSARHRVLLEAATLYFGLAVVLGIFLNYLLVAAMQDVIGPLMRGGTG